MPPVVAFINHLLKQESWAREQLLPFAGKAARLETPLLALTLEVDAQGGVVSPAVESRSEPAVVVRVALAAIADYLTGGQAAVLKHVRIEGDAEFANVISRLATQLRWEPAEDVARVLGDPVAHWLEAQASGLRQAAVRTGRSLVENVTEYLLEEQPTLVRRHELAEAVEELARLRDDLARLEKRVERLALQRRGG